MKTRVLIELEIETDKEQYPQDFVEQILDNGDLQDLIEDRDPELGHTKVTSALVSRLEDDLKEILWPGGDADHQWSADTIELVAERLAYLEPRPEPEANLKTFTVVCYYDDRQNSVDHVEAADAAAAKLAIETERGEGCEVVSVFEGKHFDLAAAGPDLVDGPDVKPTPEMLARTARLAEGIGEALGVSDTDYQTFTVVGTKEGGWPFVEHMLAANPAHAVDLLKQYHRDEGVESEVVEVFAGSLTGLIKP